jgi:hypothetical protein
MLLYSSAINKPGAIHRCGLLILTQVSKIFVLGIKEVKIENVNLQYNEQLTILTGKI